MPKTVLKHLAKRAGISLGRAEHLWDKAGDIVSSEYDEDKDSPAYWALRMGITKRMLGLSEEQKLTFKAFMESAVGAKPKYEKLDVDKAITMLNEHCKDSLWMLENDTPIWRGDSSVKFPKSGFLAVNTSLTERKSTNTSNHYTVLFDNHPEMKDFPKRSRSFIASTSMLRAEDYTHYGKSNHPFAIIPYDAAKVGFTFCYDIWDTRITAFGIDGDLESWNSKFDAFLDIKDNIESFKEFDRQLKSDDAEALDKLRNMLWSYRNEEYNEAGDLAKKYAKRFLEEIFDAFSPKKTGFKWDYPANMKENFPKNKFSLNEVWVEGKVVLITALMWNRLLEAYHGK